MQLPPHHKVGAQLYFQTPTDCANSNRAGSNRKASCLRLLSTPTTFHAMPTSTALLLRQGKHSNAPEVRLNKTAAEEN